MTAAPVICFGQQPCGFFPRRYLYAKIQTARRLQAELGGEIVFFCHDSDHDPRETRTTLRHRMLESPTHFNFEVENKLQKKYSPLYCKRIASDWKSQVIPLLDEYVDATLAAFDAGHERLVFAKPGSKVGLRHPRGLSLLDEKADERLVSRRSKRFSH